MLAVCLAAEGRARAQACCAGGTVVTPARLALHEDLALGVEVRARSNVGSFDASGRYASSDGVEQILEQDVAGSVRVTRQAQVGAVVPIVQTHRTAGTIDDWGGGVGDVALNARYDFLLATEALYWPGVALLAASTLPTGTPPDRASHPLAADATGAGTYDLTVGVSLEKARGHLFAGVNGWLTHRFARTISVGGGPAVNESFSARWTLLGVASYVFDDEAAVGLYVSMLDEGPATIDGARDDSTSLRLTTLGAAGVLPIRDLWRVQGSAFLDVPIASFGRNEPTGFGMTASLVRVWL
ncbi:MAG TPA: hypothetical protein VHL80_03335 [Polyangia bacterium]|nr:hypothetical protein [Polyangia bacterium]